MSTTKTKPASNKQTFTQRRIEAMHRWSEIAHEVADGHAYDAGEIEDLAYSLRIDDAASALQADVDAIGLVNGLHASIESADDVRADLTSRFEKASREVLELKNKLAEAEGVISTFASIGVTHSSLHQQLRQAHESAPRLYAKQLIEADRSAGMQDEPSDEEVAAFVFEKQKANPLPATWIE